MLIELSGPGKTSLWYTDNAGRRHITVSARGLLTNREWRNGFQLRKMEAVFSRLFNSANAVSGSAGLVPNAVEGIDSIGTASLATDNAEPLRLSQVMSFL